MTSKRKLSVAQRKALAAIVEREGVSGVARRLDVSPRTIERALGGLEQHRGSIELIERALTEDKPATAA